MFKNNGIAINHLLLSCLAMMILITGFVSCNAGESSRTSSQKSSFNGFDLSYSLIDKREILSGGPPKDGIPALVSPESISANQADYLNSSDRVIGVVINGEARAYPIRILIWHEIINDTLGGVPILVSYCPLCDSALVFHREINNVVREFGVSGLLYESNVLLYDRRQNSSEESLWSQLGMRAVSGPAAKQNLVLEVIDAELTNTQTWLSLHPETSVLSIDTGYSRPYSQSAYSNYFSTDNLMFHVSGRTGRRPELTNKDQIVLISVADAQKAYVYSDILNSPDQRIIDKIGDITLHVSYDQSTNFLNVKAFDSLGESISSNDIKRTYMFWFAFDAFYPDVAVYKTSLSQ